MRTSSNFAQWLVKSELSRLRNWSWAHGIDGSYLRYPREEDIERLLGLIPRVEKIERDEPLWRRILQFFRKREIYAGQNGCDPRDFGGE